MNSVDLTDTVAAVGSTIFSYLPVGSLLNGLSSPTLVNKVFGGAILEYLRDTSTLSFSQCSHLRKINDEQLIYLLQNILGGAAYLKTKQLDLSRCRNLKGDGVIFCLQRMPKIETLSLSSATRFCIKDNINDPKLIAALKQLKYVDVSGCGKLGNEELCRLVPVLKGSNIRMLDFSGCSTLNGNRVALTVAEHCNNLESINLSGAKLLTNFGVAILCYVRRSTLRCLSLCGCQSVNLLILLYSHAMACPLVNNWNARRNEPAYEQIIENFSNLPFLTPAYVRAIRDALHPLMNGAISTDAFAKSEELIRLSKEYEERWSNQHGWTNSHSDEQSIFGQLEKLDISNSFPMRKLAANPPLDRALAALTWLNRGKLREINMSGLSISPNVVSALAFASGPLLKCLEVSSLVDVGSTNFFGFNTVLPWTSLDCVKSVFELDLSCCDVLINSRTELHEMENLRSLKLNHLPIEDSNLHTLLSTTKRLLYLSVQGCKALNVSILMNAKASNSDLNLLELDVREACMDIPLSKIRASFPTLLKLNNRCTEVGTERIQLHNQSYRWRIGERSRASNKRKRANQLTYRHVINSLSLSLSCCSIQFTGLSKTDASAQEMFGCKTCQIEFGRFVCMACSNACHIALGHEVYSVGYVHGYCDCSILSDCKCIEYSS